MLRQSSKIPLGISSTHILNTPVHPAINSLSSLAANANRARRCAGTTAPPRRTEQRRTGAAHWALAPAWRLSDDSPQLAAAVEDGTEGGLRARAPLAAPTPKPHTAACRLPVLAPLVGTHAGERDGQGGGAGGASRHLYRHMKGRVGGSDQQEDGQALQPALLAR